MAEYWLLKKQLAGWEKVTWYDEIELDKAERSFKALVDAKGYAIRLVKVEVMQEHLLDEMIEVAKPEVEPVKTSWERHAKPVVSSINAPISNGWGTSYKPSPNNFGWGNESVAPAGTEKSHGLSGKVWLVNHSLKEKRRVDPSEVDAMMAQGWVRGGPRTVV